jgi:hypothetical protein
MSHSSQMTECPTMFSFLVLSVNPLSATIASSFGIKLDVFEVLKKLKLTTLFCKILNYFRLIL